MDSTQIVVGCRDATRKVEPNALIAVRFDGADPVRC